MAIQFRSKRPWVVVAPSNYAPNIISWRTLHDLLVDAYAECGWLSVPQKLSFTNDILPILRRLSNLQWVNHGFATMYGKGCPMDFDSADFIAKLAAKPDPRVNADPYAELRQLIYNSFRTGSLMLGCGGAWPRVWPWIYGDAFGSCPANGQGNMLTMRAPQADMLGRWVAGDFEMDWPPPSPPAEVLGKAPLAEQPPYGR
jgi:hypothetical protein